jgi:hypothetical protein
MLMQNFNSVIDQFAAARKLITSTEAALQACKSKLLLHVGSSTSNDVLNRELIAEALLHGEILFSYRGFPVHIDFSDFAIWLEDPTVATAAAHEVDVQSFRHWVKATELLDSKIVSVEVPCSHRNCKLTKEIDCDGPSEMRDGEIGAVHELWHCHHHKRDAWEKHNVISDELLPILLRIKQSPGCNNAKLKCKKRDIEFLLLIGLIRVETTRRGTKSMIYENYLALSGEKYLADHSAEVAKYMNNGDYMKR